MAALGTPDATATETQGAAAGRFTARLGTFQARPMTWYGVHRQGGGTQETYFPLPTVPALQMSTEPRLQRSSARSAANYSPFPPSPSSVNVPRPPSYPSTPSHPLAQSGPVAWPSSTVS